MYFPLEINEQLANAMRAAAEAKAEIGIFKKQEETYGEKRVDSKSVEELDEILCDVINRIASLSGCVMADSVVCESDKEIENRLNTESHVSE